MKFGTIGANYWYKTVDLQEISDSLVCIKQNIYTRYILSKIVHSRLLIALLKKIRTTLSRAIGLKWFSFKQKNYNKFKV